MAIEKSINTYEKIIKKAAVKTWKYKILWPVAAFIGIINSGSIFNEILKTILNLQAADKINANSLDAVFPAINTYIAYGKAIIKSAGAGVFYQNLFIAGSFAALIILIVAILNWQYIFIKILDYNKTIKKSIQNSYKQLQALFFWRLLAVNLLHSIFMIFLAAIGALILFSVPANGIWMFILTHLAVYAIVFPAAFIVSGATIIAIIHIIKHHDSLHSVLIVVTKTLKKDWLAIMELSLLIFTVNLAIVTLLIVIFSPLSAFLQFFPATAIAISLIIQIIVSGALLTFNYAAWLEFFEHIKRYNHVPVLEKFKEKATILMK